MRRRADHCYRIIYVNLHRRISPARRRIRSLADFDGNSQVLDHMFAGRSLLEKARFDTVHVNIDYSRPRTDTVAGDHEPIVRLFDLSS